MTSEQRNEIAMEVLDEVLTEATRYAKENRKKSEQVQSDIRRYNVMKQKIRRKIWECEQLDKPKDKEKWEKKYDEINAKLYNAKLRKEKLSKTDSSKGDFYGGEKMREAASKQPGRYQLPRKDVHLGTGFWIE